VHSTSAAYFLFIIIVLLAYWLASGWRLARLTVLLAANYFFCARYGLFYLALIPACSTIDYLAGLGMQSFQRPLVRRLFLGLSLVANLGLLILSRHMTLFLQPSVWDWVFPLSLSFYAFQSLSYTIDIYRKDATVASTYLGYMAAASFFPTIQAGPITRPAEILKQLIRKFELTPADGSRALFLIVFGLLKKLLIADYLAGNLVNRVFDTPNLYSGAENLAAVYVYSLALYYDFSGYTDIARGCGLLLGVRLPINFDRPYTSVNMADFWRRWHITFSNWLRDYLYFSLPGKRTRVWPYLNLVITMVLGGLWHGATWPFAIWGLLHGSALAVTRRWQAWRGRRPETGWASRAIRIFFTYQFVCLTWVFFRSPTTAVAMDILKRIGSLTFSLQNVSAGVVLVSLIGAAGQAIPKNWYERGVDFFGRTPFYVQAAAMALAVVAMQLWAGRGAAPFVYTRF
jgi:D-alanyl-lipoteichoic acid acyltransferase DltB (MBOAT superfamily)